jgi:hypothetical protein
VQGSIHDEGNIGSRVPEDKSARALERVHSLLVLELERRVSAARRLTPGASQRGVRQVVGFGDSLVGEMSLSVLTPFASAGLAFAASFQPLLARSRA